MLKRKQKKLNNEHLFVFGLFSTIYLTAKIRLFSTCSSNNGWVIWYSEPLCFSKTSRPHWALRALSELRNNNFKISRNFLKSHLNARCIKPKPIESPHATTSGRDIFLERHMIVIDTDSELHEIRNDGQSNNRWMRGFHWDSKQISDSSRVSKCFKQREFGGPCIIVQVFERFWHSWFTVSATTIERASLHFPFLRIFISKLYSNDKQKSNISNVVPPA